MEQFSIPKGWLNDVLSEQFGNSISRSQYLDALDQSHQALRQYPLGNFQNLGIFREVSQLELTIAVIYDQLDKPHLADTYYRSVLSNLLSSPDDSINKIIELGLSPLKEGPSPPKPPPPPKRAEARELFQEAYEYTQHENYDAAVIAYDKIYQLYESDFDSEALAVKARLFYCKGDVNESLNNKEQAEKNYQQMLNVFQNAGEDDIQAFRLLVDAVFKEDLAV